jgi:hypothetical protein
MGKPLSYPASHIKRRRATKAEVTSRRIDLCLIVRDMKPMTVRQVFYQASVRGLVEKSESGYAMVQTDLVYMRRAGVLPYGWLADSTRWQRKPKTFTNIETALHETARSYRKALWSEEQCYVEFWLEKDALAGVVAPITSAYDVPLMVARGYASLSFLHSAAETIAGVGVPTYLYHLGDFDPSGVNAAEKIEETIREMAPHAEVYFERLAVTQTQIDNLELPSRPTKTTDSRAKGFGDISVELDAMTPGLLRAIVEEAINRHLPADRFEELKLAEAEDQRRIEQMVGAMTGAAA